MYVEVENLSQALVALSKKLVEKGVDVTCRGFKCTEIPGAVLLCITNPTDRYVRIPERKWNKTLGWIESLWIARGDNNLEMPATYVKNLKNFSDDLKYMRAGYGPRVRGFGGNNKSFITLADRTLHHQYGNTGVEALMNAPENSVDQLRFIIEKFKEDIDTREAVITIHDPVADDFNLGSKPDEILKTKDTPCTRSIHFMIVNGKMNCYVDMRSNDLIWGLSAVNVFNFTLMQEYVAAMVGVPVGKYYHKADNLHVYEDFKPLVKEIAEKYEIHQFCSGLNFSYPQTYNSLEKFDNNIIRLSQFEKNCRTGNVSKTNVKLLLKHDMELFKDELFHDWALMIYRYWTKESYEFINPFLNELFV